MTTRSTARPVHRLRAVAIGACAVVLVAGCSSASTSSSSSSPTPSTSLDAKTAAFCASVGHIQTQVVQPSPDSSKLQAELKTFKDDAPKPLASAVEAVGSAAAKPTGQLSDSFYAAMDQVAGYVADSCGVQKVSFAVDGSNKISGVPATVPAGPTAFVVQGQDPGLFGILRKADGVTTSAQDLLKSQESGQVNYVSSGKQAAVAELTPGNYILVTLANLQAPAPSDAVDFSVQ